MKKICIFSAILMISAFSFSGCAVTDLVNKLFNKSESEPKVEAPAPEKTEEKTPEVLPEVEEPVQPELIEVEPLPEIVPEPVVEVTPEPVEPVVEEPKVEVEEVAEVEEVIEEPAEPAEPEIPANILFATKLQELLAKNDIKGAIALFDEMPKELKGDEELEMLLASLYLSAGEYEKSKATANAILKKNPKNVEALELLTLIARASGDKATYSQMTKQILAVDPTNVSANIMIAEDYTLNRKYKPAKDAYKKALKAEPDNTDALYGLALTSYYTNDIKTSRATCEKILAVEDMNPSANALLAKIVAEENSYAKATEYILKALQADPYNYEYYIDLGSYHKHRNRNIEAHEAWNKAVEIDPDYFLAYAYLAGSYDEMNDLDKALENYRKVIQTNPKYYYAYESTAVLEFLKGNYAQAQKYFSVANSYNADYSYQLMMAACYFKQNNTFEAKKILTALMKTLDRESVEYNMARFFNDPYSRNAETSLSQKITKEDNRNKKGKMLFYMGLYYEINGFAEMANEYYSKVTNMNAAMFYEYRIAEWRLLK